MESNTTVKDKVFLMVVFFWLLGATIILVSKWASPMGITINLQSSSYGKVESIVKTKSINLTRTSNNKRFETRD